MERKSWETSVERSPNDDSFLKASLYYTSKFPTSDGISPGGGGSSKFNESWPDSEKPSNLRYVSIQWNLLTLECQISVPIHIYLVKNYTLYTPYLVLHIWLLDLDICVCLYSLIIVVNSGAACGSF